MSGRACPSVCVLASVCTVLAASAPVQGRVVGRVVHVGFPAGIGRVMREGAWVPIEVELSLEGQSSFDGVLRVEWLRAHLFHRRPHRSRTNPFCSGTSR